MGGWIFGNGLVGLFSCFDGGAGAMGFGTGLRLQKEGIRTRLFSLHLPRHHL